MPLRRWLPGALAASLLGCGPVVVDHTPAGNLLDADTQDLEGGLGHWTAWFGSAIARTTATARHGAASLEVEATQADGWGVELDDWMAFSAGPGAHRLELWARVEQGSSAGVTLTALWLGPAGEPLREDALPSAPLTGEWSHAAAWVEAPAGTSGVSVTLTGSDEPGTRVCLDELMVLPAP